MYSEQKPLLCKKREEMIWMYKRCLDRNPNVDEVVKYRDLSCNLKGWKIKNDKVISFLQPGSLSEMLRENKTPSFKSLLGSFRNGVPHGFCQEIIDEMNWNYVEYNDGKPFGIGLIYKNGDLKCDNFDNRKRRGKRSEEAYKKLRYVR